MQTQVFFSEKIALKLGFQRYYRNFFANLLTILYLEFSGTGVGTGFSIVRLPLNS